MRRTADSRHERVGRNQNRPAAGDRIFLEPAGAGLNRQRAGTMSAIDETTWEKRMTTEGAAGRTAKSGK